MIKLIFFVLFYFNHVFLIYSQNVTISGYIYDEKTKQPVPQVNVSVVGNQHLRDDQTDSEGFFTITLKNGVKEGSLVRMRATKEGFVVREERIVISSLKPITLHITPVSPFLPNHSNINTINKAGARINSMISKLIENLKDDDEEVRAKACMELGKIGDPAKAATNALIALLFHDRDISVINAAALSLGKINGNSSEVKRSLYIALKDDNRRDSDTRSWISNSLLRNMKSVSELEPLVTFLPNKDVSSDIKNGIIKFGIKAIPVLKKALQQDSVNHVWLLQPLISINPNLKTELFPYLIKGLKFDQYTENEFYFWVEVIHSFINYGFKDLDAFPVLLEIFLKDVKFKTAFTYSSDDDFINNVKEPALKVLIDNSTKSLQAQSLIVEIIDKSNRKLYNIVLREVLSDTSVLKNKIITEALWNRHIKYQSGDISDIEKLVYVRYNLDTLFRMKMVEWFNNLDTANELYIVGSYYSPVPPKAWLTILLEALKKNINIQFVAVRRLKGMGSLAIEAIPSLRELRDTTSNSELKLEIERAIVGIVDK